MQAEILLIIITVGSFVWAFRVLPMRLDMAGMRNTGTVARFFAATGVAAIATLFAASILPEIANGRALPAVLGSAAVLATYVPSKSIVLATLAGAVAYGVAYGILG